MESNRSRENEWFRKNEKDLIAAARLARERREQERAERETAAARRRLKELHFMKCPKCGHDMKENVLEGIAVDQCSFCEGIFFDAGELDGLILKKQEERRSLFLKLIGL